MTEHTWKRGDRVRYTGSHCARLQNQIGTVTGRDSRGWLRVRFDFQQSWEKGEQVSDWSLEPFDGTATEAAANATRIKLARVADELDSIKRQLAEIIRSAGLPKQVGTAERALSSVREAHAAIEAAL